MTGTVSRRALMANAAALSGLAACASVPTVETPNDALGDSDAVGLAARIRAGEITAAQALDAAIARTERVNPELNFIAAPAYEFGRERAAGALDGPFAGVPTLIKDLMPLAGYPTRYGSRAFVNNIPSHNTDYVTQLLAAGLVPFGKTTTPEFGLTATTEPLLGGPTRNPWDIARSPGGSSGGAAVAVAARCAPIAHASDGGGSIRIPASCNGVLGLKYTRGRSVAEEDFLSVNGCVSRSVRDTAAWLSVTERTDADAPLPPVGLVTGPGARRLRIGVAIPDARGVEPDAEVRAAIESAAALCRELRHEVREQTLGIDGDAFAAAFTTVWAAGAAEVVRDVSRAAPGAPLDQLLEPLTLQLAQRFQEAPSGSLERAMGVLRQAEAQFAALFSEIDVLLTPVLAKVPPRLGEIAPTLGLEGFAKVEAYVAYTPLQNAAGAPAMSVPLAWSAGGLPIGAHFSAAKGQERTLLELAYELEQARPWAGRKPAVNAA
ncbi:MAG: amidase [Hyphomonadaceae bacterium]|nr:amidase [Hyphomonadaceae bacterium]